MGQYGPGSPGNSGILGSLGNQESASYTFKNPVAGSNLPSPPYPNSLSLPHFIAGFPIHPFSPKQNRIRTEGVVAPGESHDC
jgi:hypothetical protein